GVPLAQMDVFCAGHVLLDGSLFTTGGTDRTIGFFGENDSRIFTPGAGSAVGAWAVVDSMKEFRWYPTATVLRDGRVLALSGSKYDHHRIFGGRRDGTLPSDPPDGSLSIGDSLYRLAPIPGGAMDPARIPDQDASGERPAVREGHTFLDMSQDL